MYEDYERRGFPLRDFLLKLILIIIFVFLLIWLLPKFLAPAISKNIKNNCDNTNITLNNDQINAISSQIFNNNLNAMKDAAISYYTDERLPQEIGESRTMTLSEMIGLKIITPLIDKNNKAVDVEKSYVKITKTADEYILKVNIKDSETEDYILVHLGCYTYCDSYVCEKEKTQVIMKGESISETKPIVPIIKPSKPEKQPEPTPTKPDKEDPKPVDPDKPTPKPTDPEEPDPIIPDPPKPEEKKTYVYEYKKVTGAKFSSWTEWSSWYKVNCSTATINCSDSDPTCLKKLQRYDRKEQIGTYQKEYVRNRDTLVQTGSYQQKSCSNYNYVIVNNTTYVTTTTTNYSSVNNITANSGSTGSWKYVRTIKTTNPPRSTATTHYEFAGADYSYCEETCTTLPYFWYKEYQYVGSIASVGSTTSTSSKVTSSTSSNVSASCGSYVTKTIPIYSTINVSDVATRTEPLYGTVCYASTKTRSLYSAGSTKTTWSKYNDTSLLKEGWVYTGNRKEK